MKSYELLELPIDELRTQMQNTKLELSNLKFQKATHQLENPLLIRERRREIARINTLLKEYESSKRELKQSAKSTQEKQ